MLVMLCLVAIYFGAEYGYVTSQTNDTYNILTGRDPEGTGLVVMIDDNSILETALEKMGVDTSAIKESRLAEEREEIRKSGSQDLIKIRGGSRGFLSRVVKILCLRGRHRHAYKESGSYHMSVKPRLIQEVPDEQKG